MGKYKIRNDGRYAAFKRRLVSMLFSHRLHIYLYPTVVILAVFVLTYLGLSGTSMGVYHQRFYGIEAKDDDLILNAPRDIRSDEWIMGSQKVIAQKESNFSAINRNIGDGENVAVLTDAPVRDWSTFFRPHNAGFFFLPTENAFAFRWWSPLAILAIAVYAFCLTLLKRKYFLSALISIAFCASPFIHWWYGYSTVAIFAFALLGIICFIKLLEAHRKRDVILHGAGMAYSGVAFMLAFYPPFQIPVLIASAAFVVGYYLENRTRLNDNDIKMKILAIFASLVLAISLVGAFFLQHRQVLESLSNTAYPGQRIVKSGHYSLTHLLSSNYSPIFQNSERSASYTRPDINAVNGSESSNFTLITLLLFPVFIYLIHLRRRQNFSSWLLIAPLAISALYLSWMFIPNIDWLGKPSLLSMVPHGRLLMGWGILNLLMLIVFIKYSLETQIIVSKKLPLFYSLALYILYLVIGWRVHQAFPDFLGIKGIFIYGSVFPITILLLLYRRHILAMILLAIFSVYSVSAIHPLYRGLDIILETPLTTKIKTINQTDPGTWVSDLLSIENFPQMVGARSLTGTYLVPQIELWDKLGLAEQQDKYNRYAHVSFTYDRTPGISTPTVINQDTPDQFNVFIEPCNDFYKAQGVKYLITTRAFTEDQAPCLKHIDTVSYPKTTFYFYKAYY